MDKKLVQIKLDEMKNCMNSYREKIALEIQIKVAYLFRSKKKAKEKAAARKKMSTQARAKA